MAITKYDEKYDALIDAQTWKFIERTNSWYPPDTVGQPIAKQREIYNAMCREFFARYPRGVGSENRLIENGTQTIAVRRYWLEGREAKAWVLYCHGGGFVVGGLDSHDDVCAELCAGTGFDIISVDYRLSPEHKHPDAFEDTLGGFEYIVSSCDLPIVVAGDSAGANLVAALSHATRSRKQKPCGQVLIYPGLGGDMTKGSYIEHCCAPLLNCEEISFYTGIRQSSNASIGDATYAPLADTDFSNLPPTFVVSAQCDPLCDDGMHYCAKINAAGGRAKWHEETGLVHGYLRARHNVKRARDSFERIISAISMMSTGQWNY